MESTRQKIIKCFLEGKTARETAACIDTTSNYIYRVRSDYKKTLKVVPQMEQYKKTQILRVHRQGKSSQEVADTVGCSVQYVYRVLKGVSSTKACRLVHDIVCKVEDEYYTPLYAIKPIVKYLETGAVVWCPFDTEKSYYVKYLQSKGFKVVYSHLEEGQDFFYTEPPVGCQYIISNPPYSLKDRIFERLFELSIPFGMLVNITGLFSAKGRFSLLKDSMELLVFNSRVCYLRSYEEVKTTASPPFESGYVCSGILPDKLVFEELNKSEVVIKNDKENYDLNMD